MCREDVIAMEGPKHWILRACSDVGVCGVAAPDPADGHRRAAFCCRITPPEPAKKNATAEDWSCTVCKSSVRLELA
ncbi:MAG: hypothetical protein QOI41_3779, partial [Myxococcales bacterium]|nr:hypothetical protein [Myxococcales bacterium]